MSALLARLAIVGGIVFVTALPALSTGSTVGVAAAGISVLLAIAVLRVAVCVRRRVEVTVGARAQAHREVLSEIAAPRHPATAGRPLARAPGIAATA